MMDEAFLSLCRRAEMKPLARINTSHGTVFVAERFVDGHRIDRQVSTDGRPYWETLWAIQRARMEVGRIIRSRVFEMRRGIWVASSRDERVREAMADAMNFAKVTYGRG